MTHTYTILLNIVREQWDLSILKLRGKHYKRSNNNMQKRNIQELLWQQSWGLLEQVHRF